MSNPMLIASHCICCGKTLTDPESVNRGMGPECSEQGYQIAASIKEEVFALTREAAAEAVAGNIARVVQIAREIHTHYQLPVLSEKMLRRFKNAEKNAKIHIKEYSEGKILVQTPNKRKQRRMFWMAWHAIQGAQFSRYKRGWIIDANQKPAVWDLLKRFFPGDFGEGPKGLFRVPRETEQNVNSGS